MQAGIQHGSHPYVPCGLAKMPNVIDLELRGKVGAGDFNFGVNTNSDWSSGYEWDWQEK